MSRWEKVNNRNYSLVLIHTLCAQSLEQLNEWISEVDPQRSVRICSQNERFGGSVQTVYSPHTTHRENHSILRICKPSEAKPCCDSIVCHFVCTSANYTASTERVERQPRGFELLCTLVKLQYVYSYFRFPYDIKHVYFKMVTRVLFLVVQAKWHQYDYHIQYDSQKVWAVKLMWRNFYHPFNFGFIRYSEIPSV